MTERSVFGTFFGTDKFGYSDVDMAFLDWTFGGTPWYRAERDKEPHWTTRIGED